MIKRMGVFTLAEGKNPDEAWKQWIIHATDFKQASSGLKKYEISRFVKSAQKGEQQPKWWGIFEQWFESEEAFIKGISKPHPKDDIWSTFVGEKFGDAFMEEYVVYEEKYRVKPLKRLGIMEIREGVNSDEAWKYWKDVHAVNWKNTSPNLRKYVITRVIKATPGNQLPKWWGLLEQRFDNEVDFERAMNTPRPNDEFLNYGNITGSFSGLAYVEEKVIV